MPAISWRRSIPRPYQAQLDQATANRDRDQAQLANAQANLDRYTPLEAKGYATSQLVDTQKAQIAQLQAMVKSDEAVIETARINLGYTRLTAPIDGVTGIRQIDDGNIIHPTDPTGLVDLTQIQPISVHLHIAGSRTLSKFSSRWPRDRSRSWPTARTTRPYSTKASLNLIDNQIVQTTGTIRLRAKFPNTQRHLWPGELVNARLLHRHPPQRPDDRRIGGAARSRRVLCLCHQIPSGNAEMRPVKVAQISGGQALVDSGLAANETVVVDGQYKLQPGSHVVALHGKAAQQVSQQSAVEQEIP